MDDTAVRAARVMGSQSAMLRRRMSLSQPDYGEAPTGMLFKRTVKVPKDADLQRLLAKWNPGMSQTALGDLMGTVLRWNGLPRPTAAAPGQNLLIPTVVPHGQRPSMARPTQDPLSRKGLHAVKMPRSDQFTLKARLAEHRARTSHGIWVTDTDSGQALGGSQVKMQFQTNLWGSRA